MASGNVNMDFYRRFFLERQHELEEDSQQLLEGELRIQNVEQRQHHRDAHNPSMEPLDYAGQCVYKLCLHEMYQLQTSMITTIRSYMFFVKTNGKTCKNKQMNIVKDIVKNR